jgi:hypothetical protein
MAWLHAGALALLAYTHNWFLFLAIAEGLALAVLLVLEPARRRDRLRRAGVAFGVPVLLYLPWLPTVLYQAAHTGAPWSSVPGLADVWLVRTWLLAGPVALTALALAVATAAIVLWPRRPEWTQLAVLAWLAGGTLLLAFAANQAKPAWADRYAVILLGPLLLLGALAISRTGAAGLVAAVAISLAWIHQPPYHEISHRSNARVIAGEVERHARPGDLVIDDVPESLPVMRHYLGPGLRYATTMGRPADPLVMDWRNALARMRAEPVAAVRAIADAQPAGSRVVVLRPLDHGPIPNAWKETIRRRARRLSRALRHDASLRFVRRLARGFYGPKTTLRGELYVRR